MIKFNLFKDRSFFSFNPFKILKPLFGLIYLLLELLLSKWTSDSNNFFPTFFVFKFWYIRRKWVLVKTWLRSFTNVYKNSKYTQDGIR